MKLRRDFFVRAKGLVHNATTFDSTTFLWCLRGSPVIWTWREMREVEGPTCLACAICEPPTVFRLMGWCEDRVYLGTIA